MEYSDLAHWLWLLPLGLAALWVGSPRFLGTQASRRLRKLLHAGIDRRNMTLLHDLDLSVAGRIVHFDHLVLGRTGIHVIDALYLPGKVKGQRVQAWWQRLHWGRKSRFANPVHENHLRLQALQQGLHLAPGCFHPCVAVSGHSSLDTDARDVVVDLAMVSRRINSQSRPLLDAEELDQALQRIQQWRVHPGLLGAKNLRWRLLQLLLLASFLAGAAWVHQDELQQAYQAVRASSQPLDEATRLQRWEDRLICSYSVDTGRCACYKPQGEKAELTAERCRELAERGSVLQQ